MEKKDGGAKPPRSGIDSAAGFTAGVVTTMVFHPLDVIKTRLQVNLQPATGPTKPRPLSTMDVVRSFMKAKSPAAAAYRGLPINVLVSSASWACFLQCKDSIERQIATRWYGLTPGDQLPWMGYFAASGLAGIATSCITNPLWMLRTRMFSTDRHTAEAYPNMRVGALRIYHGEGFRGFYKGLGTSFIGTSHAGIQFAMYETMRNTWKRKKQQQGHETGSDGGDIKLSNKANLFITTASKSTASLVTFPHQVVRNRLQNQRDTSLYGKGITGVVRKMWQEGGIRPFYRGIVPTVLKNMPATWLTMFVVEDVRYYLPRWLDKIYGGDSGK